MTIDNNKAEAFYQNLGKLFYAVASIDGTVNPEEINALKAMVEDEWKISQETFAMVDLFNWLNNDQDYDADTCFKQFLLYLQNNAMYLHQHERH